MKYVEKNKIILILDEITSGWRQTVGGTYRITGFKPDIIIMAKVLQTVIQFQW